MLDDRINFYLAVLKKTIVDRGACILVVAAGQRDRAVFESIGFKNVIFSNIDSQHAGESEFKPFEYINQDVQDISYHDCSFDYVVIHNGLHHCRSPHRALLEMFRVSKHGILVFESCDNVSVRIFNAFSAEKPFEVQGVYFNGGKFGGLENGPIPNFIYRWTEREIVKTIKSFSPHLVATFKFFYGHSIPAELFYPGGSMKRMILKYFYYFYLILIKIFPKQQNLFAFYIGKTTKTMPWIKSSEGRYAIDMEWAKKKYGKQ
jgi:SAM-dependent methyltransferase